MSCCDPQPKFVVLAALHYFASPPNQPQTWRMHVSCGILALFLRRADPPTDAADQQDQWYHEPGDGASLSGLDYGLF